MQTRASIAILLAALSPLSCKSPFSDKGTDAAPSSSPRSDPAAQWVGKWHGGGTFVITATNQKPITGAANVDITIERGDGSNAIRLVTADGKGYDLVLDPAHPDTARTGAAISQTTAVSDAKGHYEATATLAGGKMHLVQTSSAHGDFHFDNLHGQADAKTVTTVDLDRVK